MSRSPVHIEIGNDTGNVLTSTVVPVNFTQTFTTSALAKSVTRVVPTSAQILFGSVIVETAVTGSVGSMTVRVGVSASVAQYGTVNVSAAGAYNIVLTRFATQLDLVSTGQVVVDVTAATSGAAHGGNIRTRLVFGRI